MRRVRRLLIIKRSGDASVAVRNGLWTEGCVGCDAGSLAHNAFACLIRIRRASGRGRQRSAADVPDLMGDLARDGDANHWLVAGKGNRRLAAARPVG